MDPQQIATLRDWALVYFAFLGGILLLPIALMAILLNLYAWRRQRRLRAALRAWQGELSDLQHRTRHLARALTRSLVGPLSLAAGISRTLRVFLGRR